MNNSTAHRRVSLGMFPATPWLYHPQMEVLETQRYSRRTEQGNIQYYKTFLWNLTVNIFSVIRALATVILTIHELRVVYWCKKKPTWDDSLRTVEKIQTVDRAASPALASAPA